MNRLRLRRPSAAIIVSTIALVVALGGTSYAAFTLPQNSVGTKQLKDKAVTLAKIAPAARSALSTAGPQGKPGLPGQPGQRGEPGPAGPSFGDSTSFNGTVGLCAFAPAAKLSITVTSPSRIFASFAGEYFLNGGQSNEPEFEVELRDSGDTTTLAVLPIYDFSMSSTNVDGVPFASEGVLRSGSDPVMPGATAYVAQPGNYLLKWLVAGYGGCTNAAAIGTGSLTYLLLGTSP
jgi:hypothetical protein